MSAKSAPASSLSSHLLDEAAQWLARQHSGSFTQDDQAGLAQWREQSEAHRQVWAQAQLLAHKFGMVPPAVGMAVLDRRRIQASNRRALLRLVAALAVVPAGVWLGLSAQPWWQLGAGDYRTATGEQRDILLADGSQLTLNTATAIRVKFDARQRLIVQHGGEILVDSAPDTQPVHRPLLVQTSQGLMEALGTRFVVRTDSQSTRLAVLEGSVRVSPSLLTASRVVNAGEQLQFSSQFIGAVTAIDMQVAAWKQGFIYADEMSLQDFISELSRYRTGLLRCDPEVRGLRVSGIFQINDTDKVLQLLASTLPIRVQMRTPYWVVIAGKD
ncbi:MAG: FecR family protein [Comamonas sp.]